MAAAATAEEIPISDDVTDLNQRLAILQGKRADDKARIKELEKYKAHYLQVQEFQLQCLNACSVRHMTLCDVYMVCFIWNTILDDRIQAEME